ncbi:hypothetical protein [Paenibacillus chitinolyticus]
MENGEFLFVFGYFVFKDGLYRERESFFRHFKSVRSGTVKISGYQKNKDIIGHADQSLFQGLFCKLKRNPPYFL